MHADSGERPEIAMVSRIRVEVRGETMEAAEQVAFQVLDHARMAGILEGYVPPIGEYTDHFFNRPVVVRGRNDPVEPWNEIGLSYYGRLSFSFEPMSVYGGLKQFGYTVERDGDHASCSEHGLIVLERQRPVSREHTWEISPMQDAADETGESILADIRTIKDVRLVEAGIRENQARVEVAMDGWEDVVELGATLYEAAAKARRSVVEMVNGTAMHAAADRIAGV